MNHNTFAAGFHEYEIDLDYYHGKDLVHQGCLLKIDPEYSWEKINGKIRNKIRKAQKLNVRIDKVKGTAEDIEKFRTVWFDPEDDTLPSRLENDEVMYLTYLDDVLSGGLILTPSSTSVLYMHNLGSNEEGKRQNIPALTLWHAVEDLKDSVWKYIDVGVSFRPTLYTFFKNWQTAAYPIIFSPPMLTPDIRLQSFTASEIPVYKQDAGSDAQKTVKAFFGDDHTILPTAAHGLKALLKHLAMPLESNVAVFKSLSDINEIDPLIRETIKAQCGFTRTPDETTKAILVVHEFGFPYPELAAVKQDCEQRGIPLIEYCVAIDEGAASGKVGDYAIYDLPAFLPMQYGGVVRGLSISDEENWNTYRMLDFFKRELVVMKLDEYLPQLVEYAHKRQYNWEYLKNLFTQDGFKLLTELPEGAVPTGLLVNLEAANEVVSRYAKFGVEARAYGQETVVLPVHQNLSSNQLDYIYGVFRGKLNLSSNYSRGGQKG